jgi:glycosyltransferase involved in cell wall biosynthesis
VRVLIDYRPALRERSGVGEYTHELVKALLAAYPPARPESTFELSLFSSSWKDRFVPAPELAGATIVDRRIPVRLLNLAWHRLGWPPAEALAGGRYDVTHSLHPLLLPSRAAAQVITIHDLSFLKNPDRTRAEIRRDYPALARDHAHRADAIIVPSAYTGAEVERLLGVPRERIVVGSPGAPAWTPRAAAPKDGYVLFFGTLEPRKNVGGLLDAYALLVGTAKAAPYNGENSEHDNGRFVGHPFRGAVPGLVLAGKATDEARPWLERLARPPLQGMVRHIGYVDPRERRALYEGARLLVQPSFDEGFGIPVLEAMSLGVPVVAANRGSLPQVVGDAGPLVDPEDPAAIANAIARVLSDGAYAAACAAKGLVRARTFRWDETAHRVYDTYRQAIAQRARKKGYDPIAIS